MVARTASRIIASRAWLIKSVSRTTTWANSCVSEVMRLTTRPEACSLKKAISWPMAARKASARSASITSPTASADSRRRTQFAPQMITPMRKSASAREKVAGVTWPSAMP